MSEAPKAPAMPLSMVKAGQVVTVDRVRGDEGLKHHLENLGFVEGAKVNIVSSAAGNIIVTVKDARFGLDQKAGQHIMVREG